MILVLLVINSWSFLQNHMVAQELKLNTVLENLGHAISFDREVFHQKWNWTFRVCTILY